MGVEPLELYAGVGGGELPIGFDVVFVAVVLPSGDLGLESVLVGNAAAQQQF